MAGREGQAVALPIERTFMDSTFRDEEGKLHSHDPNAVNTLFRCSNGHEWQEMHLPKCWCGWSLENEAAQLRQEGERNG